MGYVGCDGDVVGGVVPLMRPGDVFSCDLGVAFANGLGEGGEVCWEGTFGEGFEVVGEVGCDGGGPGCEVWGLAERRGGCFEVGFP